MPAEKNRSSKSVRQSKAIEKQYAALCFRHVPGWEHPVQVLLISSRDTGRWVIPKGWNMAKKKPYEVAQREAWEEAGVRGKVRKKPCGYYTYRKRLSGNDSVLAVVQVHLLSVLELDQEFPEKGQRELRWFSPAAAAEAVYEADLKLLIAGARELASQFINMKHDVL